MGADGSSPTRLTNDDAALDTQPAWSPDGTKIAFSSDRDGNFEIYVMQPDGSNPTRLTNNLSLDGEPNWSPDGTRMVFVTQRDIPSLWEIYVMDADGSIQRGSRTTRRWTSIRNGRRMEP